MQVPGKVGWPIIGDKSVEFYRDPLKFLDKNIANKGKVFAARFLNKPTVFVCSNEGVREVLNDSENAFELGYEQFLGQMFGHNILFTKNDEATCYREALSCLLTSECITSYERIIHRILDTRISSLTIGQPICLYQFLKKLFTEICLSLFLGVDFSNNKDISEDLIKLATTHWHGIVAVPVELKLPGTGTASTYSRALQAKAQLLELIRTQKGNATWGFPCHMRDQKGLDETSVNQHLLLFTSSLVPKILASICTTICVEIGRLEKREWQEKAKDDQHFLENLILEAKRINPPLLGGRRVTKKDCVIEGYVIPKDYAVVYMTRSAHRDSTVFDNPDQFMPERWDKRPELKNKLFVYGFGPRACIGQNLSWLLLESTLSGLLSRFTWEICPNQELTHKYIPVFRPKCNLLVTMSQR